MQVLFMLYQIFYEAVQKNPDQVALKFEDESAITYAELSKKVDLFAQKILHSKKVKAGEVVSVYLERSPDQVIAFLAIQRLGCVYLPLNHEESESCLKRIIKECQVALLIRHSRLPDLNSNLAQMVLVENEELSSSCVIELPLSSDDQESLSYIISSSGSTGNPKFIPIKHSGLDYWHKILPEVLEVRPKRVLANTAVSFDPSIWEYLMAWTFQAELHLTGSETRKDSRQLATFMSNHQVTDATLTPATIRELINFGFCNQFDTEDGISIYSTGEACTQDIVSAFESKRMRLYNCYGPSEATFGLSVQKIEGVDDLKEGKAPIALPPVEKGALDNVSVQIIDENNKEVCDQGEGQLVIVSPHLSPGYIGAPQETAKYFKRIHVGGIEKTAYFTGDNFIFSGNKLYFQGRNSEIAHVKIHGQKVTPITIEEVLRQHTAVLDACVIAKKNTNGEHCLVSYIVPSSDFSANPPSFNELRSHLISSQLPKFFMPSHFVYVEFLPTTSHGKVDRRELVDRKLTIQRSHLPEKVCARTPLEVQILEICRNVLLNGIQDFEMGVIDALVYLGGNSINIVRIVSEIERQYSVELPIVSLGLLDTLTVEKLANMTYLKICAQRKVNSVKLLKEGEEEHTPTLFLIHPITGEASMTYKNLAEKININMKIYAVDAPMLEDDLLSCCSVENMAKSYVQMIREKQSSEAFHLLGWSSGSYIAYEMARQLEQQGERVNFLGLVDEPSPKFIHELSENEFYQQLLKLKNRLLPNGFNLDNESDPLTKSEQIMRFFPEEVEGGQEVKALNFTRIFLYASLNYHPSSLEKTEVSVFVTEETYKESSQGVDSDPLEFASLGWSNDQKSCRITKTSGNHFSIMERDVESFAKQVSDSISCLLVANKNKAIVLPQENAELNARLENLENMMKILIGQPKGITFFQGASAHDDTSESKCRLPFEKGRKRQCSRESVDEQTVDFPVSKVRILNN